MHSYLQHRLLNQYLLQHQLLSQKLLQHEHAHHGLSTEQCQLSLSLSAPAWLYRIGKQATRLPPPSQDGPLQFSCDFLQLSRWYLLSKIISTSPS